MGFKRHANAHWEGDLKSGQGRLSTPQSGAFEGLRYSFNSRFADEKGSNPEELLAAAHAGCFAMAMSFMLGNAGYTPTRIDAKAEVSMELSPGPHAVGVHLTVSANVPGIDAATFAEIAANAKENCVISRALSLPITLTANLV